MMVEPKRRAGRSTADQKGRVVRPKGDGRRGHVKATTSRRGSRHRGPNPGRRLLTRRALIGGLPLATLAFAIAPLAEPYLSIFQRHRDTLSDWRSWLPTTLPLPRTSGTFRRAREGGGQISLHAGWRLEQTFEALERSAPGIDIRRLQAVARTGQIEGLSEAARAVLSRRPVGASLEGYLFPGTYEVPTTNTSPEDLLRAAIERLAKRFPPSAWSLAERTTGLTRAQLVILASIVERETARPDERGKVAGVYLNRLRQPECLCADPTVQYGLGRPGDWWPLLRARARDLAPESFFNTYTHRGLPPGPICSPGEEALRAAMQPASTDELYFVRNDIANDGSHVFARTLAEHEANRARVQRHS